MTLVMPIKVLTKNQRIINHESEHVIKIRTAIAAIESETNKQNI